MNTASVTPSVIVLGWGNVTRTDDALGPLLLERVRSARLPHVTVVEDFQLQVEHALDLRGHDLALFADAGFETPAPFAFSRIEPQPDTAFSSHKLAPEAVLDVYQTVIGETPPPAFVLTVPGEDFTVGDTLTPAAAQRLELASDFLIRLLRFPSLENWQAAANAAAGRR